MIIVGGLEAARSLSSLGTDSPSEMSLVEGALLKKKDTSSIVNTLNRELAEGTDTGPLFQIWLLEGGTRGGVVGTVAGDK